MFFEGCVMNVWRKKKILEAAEKEKQRQRKGKRQIWLNCKGK